MKKLGKRLLTYVLVPVSYTHLDVYKRQKLESRGNYMKKRRMKLLALMLTAAVTITSVLPVGAAAADGSEAPKQVTELTDPLNEGGGTTDNDLGDTSIPTNCLLYTSRCV